MLPLIPLELPRFNDEPELVTGSVTEVAEASPSTGAVKVLFVSVSVPASVARVPVVGRVIDVVPVAVKVVANAPLVVRFPPSVMVLLVFATPVPPLAPGRIPVMPEEMLGKSPAAIARVV